MHELAAVESMVQVALEKAQEVGSPRVVGLHFVINAGGHVSEESVRLCFDIAAKDTPAQGAELFFVWNPPRYRCFRCGHVFEGAPTDDGVPSSDGTLPCRQCGEPALPVPPAEEFFLDSIDIE